MFFSIFSLFFIIFLYQTVIQNLKLVYVLCFLGIIFHELTHLLTAITLGLKVKSFKPFFIEKHSPYLYELRGEVVIVIPQAGGLFCQIRLILCGLAPFWVPVCIGCIAANDYLPLLTEISFPHIKTFFYQLSTFPWWYHLGHVFFCVICFGSAVPSKADIQTSILTIPLLLFACIFTGMNPEVIDGWLGAYLHIIYSVCFFVFFYLGNIILFFLVLKTILKVLDLLKKTL